MHYLALTVPGYGQVHAPSEIPGGGGMLTLLGSTQAMTLLVFVIASVIALFFMIWGGIQWIMSEGDKSKVQAARMRITYALIGLVLMFLSFFIVNLVGHLFSVPLT